MGSAGGGLALDVRARARRKVCRRRVSTLVVSRSKKTRRSLLQTFGLAASFAAVAVLLAAGAAGARGTATYDLEGGVDDDWSIWLVPPGGDLVKTLPPRTYVIDVSDSSKEHNFHLRGPGIDRATPLRQETYTTWTVTLSPGTYEYFSDSQPTEIHETFTVSTAAAPLPTPCRVPRVVRMRLAVARVVIRRARCSVGRVRSVRSRLARGRVVRQAPRPGTTLRPGGRVALVISRGPN
jgi:hypothetical protein